ncbi:MAG: hypothetical protein J6S49_08080 [Erysipelotrichaceae bacterium]|nr:hypothetical protein [Erysipelotrichaceae bacterium]
MKMKKMMIMFLIAIVMMTSGCEKKQDGEDMKQTYTQISQEQAKQMMEKNDGHVIVDVRRQDEYDEGHIPGAILIPNESIDKERPELLPDLNQIILIYCRSGNRSKQASQKLADMGYANIYEFGGIIDWTGEIVASDEYTDLIKPVPALVIEVNGHILYADLEDNSSAEAFIEKLNSEPIELQLHEYGNFEKVGPLPWSLPRNDTSITTVPGDVILYQGNQLTIYYDQNTWDFTRLAKIKNVTRDSLLDILGDGDVTVKMWIEWSE